MTSTVEHPPVDAPVGDAPIDAACVVRSWLSDFANAVDSGDVPAVVGLFADDGYWRDAVALSWDLRLQHGREKIGAFLTEHLADSGLGQFEVWDGGTPSFNPTGEGTGYVEGFLRFRTTVGWGLAVVRLVQDEREAWVAWTLLTALQELDGFELAAGLNRPVGERIPNTTWSQRRRTEVEFADDDPEVVILGGAQAGMAAGAYLRLMGIPALIIERNPRVGDIWRNRYDALVLHDPIWLDQMPFMPFPESWPVYTPKDKVGDWFDIYAAALDLNVWTSSHMTGCTYSESDQRWTVEVRRGDGSSRILRPRHFVLATGMLTEPHVPDFAGVDEFEGVVRHTSEHGSGQPWKGKRALVVGTGNSGNDVAKDLVDHGADVTMLQRSPTYVVTQKDGLPVLHGTTYAPGGPGLQVADLMNAATPYPVAVGMAPVLTKLMAERDRALLDGLAAAGFQLDDGQESGGVVGLGLRTGGGFMVDVGSADYIVDGRIAIAGGSIARFTRSGVELTDGTEIPADLVVLATGFKNMREGARRILGDHVADMVPPIWGLDEEGELNGMWRPSGHPGLWFTGGSFAYTRIYTRFMAIQIAAELSGKK